VHNLHFCNAWRGFRDPPDGARQTTRACEEHKSLAVEELWPVAAAGRRGTSFAEAAKTMSSPNKSFVKAPVADEWGFYDPDRAGLAAVLEKLELRWRATAIQEDPRSIAAALRDAKTIERK
jgi:hypothetical protein